MAKNTLSAPSNLKSKISNPQSLRILMVEDSEDDMLLIIRELKKGGYDPVYERVETEKAMSKALREKPWDIILCDYKLPKFSAISAIAVLKETNIDMPLIIVSGTISEETAVECMRLGADDYIMKNNLSRLVPAIERELKEAESRVQRKRAEEALQKSEHTYRLLAEHMSDIVWMMDMDLNVTWLSPSAMKARGFSVDEIAALPLDRQLTPESLKKAVNWLGKLMRLEKDGLISEPDDILSRELEFYCKDGRIIVLDSTFQFIRDEQGKAMGILAEGRDITKRKNAEEVLRQSEEKYRNILENIEDGYYEVDLAGNLTFFNDSMCRLYGYSKEELMGMNNRQYVDKETSKEVFQAFNKVYSTGEPTKEFNWQAIRKDGTKRYVEASASLQKDSSGKPIGFRGIIRDITERKRAEETLRVSEEKYRLVVENAKEGIIIAQDLNLVFVNRAAIDMIGYSGEILVKSFTDFIHPDDRNMVVDYHIRRLKGEEVPLAYSFRLISQDGTVKWVEFNTAVIQWEERPATLSFLNDITERKQAEEELRESEEKYRTIIETIQDGYLEVDLAGNYTFVNNVVCEHLRYSREELMGMNARQVQDETNFKKTYQTYDEVYRTGRRVNTFDFEAIRKDGTKGIYEQSISLMRDAQGKPIGFRGISRDVSERKQIEEKIRRSEEKYRTIIETIQDGYFETDLTGKFTLVNDAECNNLGYTREELFEMKSAQYAGEKNRKPLINLFIEIYKTGIPVQAYNLELIKKDGTKAFNEISVSLIRNSKDEPIGFRGIARDVTERKQAEEERQQSFDRLRKALGATVQSISMIVEMKDPYTSGHQRRVSDLARSIATEMGLSADRQDFIRTASSIHDIGKIALPTEILSKPTKLTDLEFSLIKTHSQSGYDILKDIEFPWPVADVVLQHHERMDGSGYPQGLQGENILLEARILAIADVVEAIGSHRPYRPSLGIDFALEEISRNRGILYDADAVDACLKLFREKGYTLVLKNA